MDKNNRYSDIYGQMNQETKTHSKDVADICCKSAVILGLDPDRAYTIGLLHDIGKIYIPSRILKKDNKLNELEREIIDMHSYYGYRIVMERGESADVYIPILYHHGFSKPKIEEPKEQITTEMLRYTMLIHSADIYDARVKKRTYHDPLPQDEVIKILREEKIADRDTVDAIMRVVQEKDITDASVILCKDYFPEREEIICEGC